MAYWTPSLRGHCSAATWPLTGQKSRKLPADITLDEGKQAGFKRLIQISFKPEVRRLKVVENVPFTLSAIWLSTSFFLIQFIMCSATPEPRVLGDLGFCLLSDILPSSVHPAVSVHRVILRREAGLDARSADSCCHQATRHYSSQ